MAYLDAEFNNIRLIWSRIGDRVLVALLVAMAMGLASFVAIQLGHGPIQITP
ncbi:hypothetical protein ROE7235_01989 [Roseibaca ekhonensis]|uniref:Uncharacterized protein n=1 Tax=Roseinatronobacter ekhonensis TaxID=254356 RepID=A0A3B0MTT5_9RHOB|nr:hypothetical protein [Roseibaca ekhonensis]SUZ32234.1 hypothetical protein ROE7235_01989 [Roseibaca ekhonensis]